MTISTTATTATTAQKTVVMMIGAGGSGKSFSLKRSSYAALAIVNSDAHIEGSPEWVGNGGSKEAFELHAWASDLMETDWNNALAGDDSFILDGTGKTAANVEARMAAARAAGFSITVFWVYAPLETCLARNAKRSRTVPTEVITDAWTKVKANFPAYRAAADTVTVAINY
jgi:predicted kinase